MRTRFLGTDFFFAESKSQIHFNPIYLRPPEPSDPDCERIRSESGIPVEFTKVIALESGITGFSLNKALSVLLNELRPQLNDADVLDGLNRFIVSEKELVEFLFGEGNEVGFGEDGSKSKKMEQEKKLQFDLMDLDLPRRELVRVKEKEHGFELCFGSPNFKIPLDIIDLDAEITVPYEEKLLESLYKIEKIPSEFDKEKSSSNSDSAFNYRAKITQFELKDSIISEQDTNISPTKTEPFNFNSALSIVDLVKGPQEEDLVLNPSQNSDILSFISENPKLEPSVESKPIALNSVLDMEIIKLNNNNDNILIKKDSFIYPLKPNGTHSESPCSVSFQEIQIMDLDYNPNNVSEIFNNLGEMDVEKTEEFPKVEMDKAGEFFESIISAELALEDETFKSLPTPVVTSDEKLNILLSQLQRDLISEMKPRVFSSCDMIYLNWHFSIEETCENQICCGFKNSVEELSDCDLVKELSFLEEENSVDIIGFFDGNLETSKVSGFDSKAEIGFDEKKILECFKDESVQKKKEKKGENIGLAKASVLFESMSHGNDLNFFLGVRKGGSVSKKETCVLTEPDLIPKEPIIQPATSLKEPIIQPALKDPSEKIPNPSNNPHYKSSEKQIINSIINPNHTNNNPSINFSSFPTKNINPSLKHPSLLNPTIPSIPTIPDSLSDIIIIINTESTQKPMLISRRTSYQKILNLEKNGARIIERETSIPLDLVFSAGVCLVWYEMGSFGKMNINEGPSCIQMFIENIATNVLMSLSYSFTGCIMIFEGDLNLLTVVMDLSDALYSASINLNMNLQIICSQSADSSDDIIMTCISNLSKPLLNPSVSESETLGESFLTKFPSINPLSANAILQSGGILVDFLEWSNEKRIQAVGKFRVSSESLDLFGTVCRFGENGESMSVMTTESSSVGSDLSTSLFRSVKKTMFSEADLDLAVVSDEFFGGKPFDEGFEKGFKEFPFVEDQTKKSVSSIVDQFIGRNKGVINSKNSNYKDFNFGEEIEQQCNNDNNLFGEDIAFNSELSSFAFRPDLRNKPGLEIPLSFQKPGFGFQTFPSAAELAEETTSNYTSQKENFNPSFNTNLSKVVGLESKSGNSSPKPGPLWRSQFPVGGETGKQSSSSSTSSRSKETYCKIRSPSIYQKGDKKESGKKQKVERFKYQGAGNRVNPIKEKWKDFKFREVEMQESEKRKNPDLITPNWNPGEKRERENPALNSRIWNTGGKRERENPAFDSRIRNSDEKREREHLTLNSRIWNSGEKRERENAALNSRTRNTGEKRERGNPALNSRIWNPGENRERENQALNSRIWNPDENMERENPNAGEKREREDPASIAPTWTPVDKRARQNLSFTRQGKTKQSKLVWRKNDSPCISVSLGKRPFQNI